jgi:hypothetical protein
MAAPLQGAPHLGRLSLQSEELAAHESIDLHLGTSPSGSAAPGRPNGKLHGTVGGRSTAAGTSVQESHESMALLNKLVDARKNAVSAQQSIGHSTCCREIGYMDMTDTTQCSNVLFELRSRIDEASKGLTETSNDYNQSIPATIGTAQISRTIAGSLFPPSESSVADSHSSGSGTSIATCGERSTGVCTTTAPKRLSDSTVSGGDKRLSLDSILGTCAVDHTWGTQVNEEIVLQASETSSSGPRTKCPDGILEQHDSVLSPGGTDRTEPQRSSSFQQAMLRSPCRAQSEFERAYVRTQQEAEAVMRYHRRLQMIHGTSFSQATSMEVHKTATHAADAVPRAPKNGSEDQGLPADHSLLQVLSGALDIRRRRETKDWIRSPACSSVQVFRGSLDRGRRNASLQLERPDAAFDLGIATNPLISILRTATLDLQQVGNKDTAAPCRENLKLPEGTCLLSPFCMLEAATAAASKPDSNAEDLSIPDIVIGMSTSHPVRRLFIAMTVHPAFDVFMTIAVGVSIVSMMFERPTLPNDSMIMFYLKASDVLLTIIFGSEVLLKIVTYGTATYWKSHSNKIDVLIVITSILLIIFDLVGLQVLKNLRCESAGLLD